LYCVFTNVYTNKEKRIEKTIIMVEIKLEKKIDWPKTMKKMESGEQVIHGMAEYFRATRTASNLKSNGTGIWSISKDLEENIFTIKRIS